jgi:hypothetical protein
MELFSPLDLSTVTGSSLARKVGKRAVAGRLEFTVTHFRDLRRYLHRISGDQWSSRLACVEGVDRKEVLQLSNIGQKVQCGISCANVCAKVSEPINPLARTRDSGPNHLRTGKVQW